MNVRYRILFNIEVLHDYYGNLKCTDVTLRPSPDTLAKLSAGQMLYKSLGNRLVVLVKVDEDDKPYVTLDKDLKLRFYIDLQHHNFITISNINLDDLRSKRMYFNNLLQNKQGSTLYLSKPLPAYNGATPYNLGDMALAGGNAFECIKTPVAGNATDKTDYWYPRETGRYVTTADMALLSPGVRNFRFDTESKVFTIKVSGLNPDTNLYESEVLNEVRSFDNATKDVQLDLRHLPQGMYAVQINGQTFMQYIDAEAVYGNVVGIVDIFNHLEGSDDFALLNTAGETKEHTYTIRFANRLAKWKYLAQKKGVKNINDTTHTYTFTQTPDAPAAAEYFESDKPIPLKQAPRVFELELSAPLGEPPPAPNPNPNDSGMLIRSGNQYVCKIYLNH